VEKIWENESNRTIPLREKVFHHLRNRILEGTIEPGEDLIETKLADELGVSRTPIREAFRKLELEGLVFSTPNKGVVVKGISDQDTEDIFAIRMHLEPLAACWAAKRITEEDVLALEETTQLMDFYIRKGDLKQASIKNTDFHRIIFNAAKSKPLKQILNSLQEYVHLARLASLRNPGRPEKALAEHQEILQAIASRDEELASARMYQHVFKSSESAALQKQKGKID
jgi:DNA-binding GntR family transcriptional regulator